MKTAVSLVVGAITDVPEFEKRVAWQLSRLDTMGATLVDIKFGTYGDVGWASFVAMIIYRYEEELTHG